MKINAIPFGKTLKANCQVINNNKPIPCKIYEINPIDDNDYFLKLKNSDLWSQAHYIDELNNDFSEQLQFSYEKTYVLENLDNDCYGIISLYDDKEKNLYELSILEVSPEFAGSKDKQIKYIGETLLSFAVGLCGMENKKYLYVPVWKKTAQDFYTKYGFMHDDYEETLILKKCDFKNLQSKNTEHTKSKIDFIA